MSGAALRQARFDAALTKPIGEARGREGLAILRGQERQMLARRGVEDRFQIGVDRNAERGSRLLLPDLNRVLADVLAAHPYNVAAAC